TKDTVNNPVLVKGAVASWDAWGVGAPCVILDGTTYKMWYTGMDASQVLRIGYATASNPEGPWTKHGSNPVVNIGTTWDENGVGGASVIREDATTYKMWYTGRDDDTTTLGLLAIGYATSSDGISWTKDGSNPVFEMSTTPTDWDGQDVGAACVIPDGSSYIMYYTGYGPTIFSQIGMALSDDGLVWTRASAINPIIGTGAAASWEDWGVGAPCAVTVAGVGTNVWYTGTRSNLVTGVGYAGDSEYSTTFSTGWNMFSLPRDPGGDFDLALGDDVSVSVVTFWYNPGTGGYQMYPTIPVPAEIGRGYWMNVTAATRIDVDDGVAATTTTYADAPTPGKEFFAINMGSPWNMIGDPFLFDVDWADCLVLYDHNTSPGSDDYWTIAEAHAANYVSQFFFAYSGGGYVQYDATTGMLEPWTGYWARAYVDCVLLVPPIEATP
ncbi:hypothetical protein ACFLVI_04510, partial [Chloroflexota bacterium]